MIKNVFCIILICSFLLITPVSGENVIAKVDDKGVVCCGSSSSLTGTLHTQYGWITVGNDDYNKIKINDTITYNTDLPFLMLVWDVKKVS